jgi:hypothetical protein
MSSQEPNLPPPSAPPITWSQPHAPRATAGDRQSFQGSDNVWSLQDYVNNAGWKFWAIFVSALVVIGGAAVLAIGGSSSSSDNYRPSPAVSSQRAWLSPNSDGDDCRWVQGKASDYGGSWSFCSYPAP